jgi:hypothetical protein
VIGGKKTKSSHKYFGVMNIAPLVHMIPDKLSDYLWKLRYCTYRDGRLMPFSMYMLHARFEVFVVVKIEIMVFWVSASCMRAI